MSITGGGGSPLPTLARSHSQPERSPALGFTGGWCFGSAYWIKLRPVYYACSGYVGP